MSDRAGWTQEELVQRVAAALAGPAYPGAPNGRIRDVPDRRTVRWYTTIGLVDRPSGMRGRTALYGQRHLLQIVAIKRLQSQGLSIAEIQAQLVGATNTTLRRIAGVTDEVSAAQPGEATTSRPKFWADRPAAATPAPQAGRADSVSVRAAVDLPGGAVLLLPGRPDGNDLIAIRQAVTPLLDLLADRGLINPDNTDNEK